MKLTVSTLSCPTWNLEQIVHACRASGITGIDFRGIGPEIDITRLPEFDGQLKPTLELLSANQITMPCLSSSVTLVSPSAERWETMLAEAQRYARLAEKTSTPYVRIFGGGIPNELTRDEARTLAQRHLRQIIKICKPHDCIPILESHDDWATSGRILELLHEIDPADVAVLWDLEHPWRQGESPAETAQALGKYIRHIHIKDTVDIDGKRHPTLIGAGLLPLMECAAALAKINFDGWYCLEMEKRWDASAPEPELSVPQFAAYMREKWNKGGL